MKIELEIQGMSCGHCVAAVRSALASVPGVEIVDVRVGAATVEIDGSPATISAVTAAVDDAGYPAAVRH